MVNPSAWLVHAPVVVRWWCPTSIFHALLSSCVLPPKFPMFGDWCVDWLLSFASAMSNSKMFFYALCTNCSAIMFDRNGLGRFVLISDWHGDGWKDFVVFVGSRQFSTNHLVIFKTKEYRILFRLLIFIWIVTYFDSV